MATLKFENYFFRNFSFNENENFDNKSEGFYVDFVPSAEINIVTEKNTAIVILESGLGNPDKRNCPFFGSVSLVGIFRIEYNKDDEEDSDLAEKLLIQNTLAILFPYLRSFISDMTLKTNKYPPFILPPINIIEMVEEGNSITVNKI